MTDAERDALCEHDPAYAAFINACLLEDLEKYCGKGPYSVEDVVYAAVHGDSVAFRLLPPVRVGKESK